MMIKNELIVFPARDGMNLFGDYSHVERNDKLFILLPGLTGSPQQYLFMKLRDELVKKGYDVFIANIYSSQNLGNKSPRSLAEISMKRHIEDFDDMISFFKKNYDKIYALGHSLSGRTILLSQNVTPEKIILLDPSGNFDSPVIKEKLSVHFKSLKEGSNKYIDWGDGLFYLCGEIIDEIDKTPFDVIKNSLNKVSQPALILSAELSKISYGYKESVPSNFTFDVIEGATHCFTEIGAIDKVCEKIINFVK